MSWSLLYGRRRSSQDFGNPAAVASLNSSFLPVVDVDVCDTAKQPVARTAISIVTGKHARRRSRFDCGLVLAGVTLKLYARYFHVRCVKIATYVSELGREPNICSSSGEGSLLNAVSDILCEHRPTDRIHNSVIHTVFPHAIGDEMTINLLKLQLLSGERVNRLLSR